MSCGYVLKISFTLNLTLMIRLLFLSFLAITLLSACDDDDDRMQPIEDVIPPGLNIFECSEWETINLYKSFARRVEDTIYQTLHVNYPMICAAGANRFEVSSRIIGEGSVIFNSELTGLAFKDGAIYAAGKVGMVGRGPDTLLLGDNNQEYAGLANFQDEVYSLFGQDGDRATNTIYKIGRPTSPVSPYDTMALGRPRKLFSKENGGTLWIWTENNTIIELKVDQVVNNVYDASELPTNFSGPTNERRRSFYFDERVVFLGTSQDSELALYQISAGSISANIIDLDTITGSQIISAVTFHNDRIYVNLLQGDESNLYLFPIASDGSQNGTVEKFSTKLPDTEVLRDLEIVDDRIFLLFNNSIRYGGTCIL